MNSSFSALVIVIINVKVAYVGLKIFDIMLILFQVEKVESVQ